jgi:DNA primase
MNVIDLVNLTGLKMIRVSSVSGGEYAGPCPFCREGNDRFHVWPNASNLISGKYVGGRYWCRQCGVAGDGIKFARELFGWSYQEACARLSLPSEYRQYFIPPRTFDPSKPSEPPMQWQSKASAMAEWAHQQILSHPDYIKPLFERGFKLDSIKLFKLGFNSKELFRRREDWGLTTLHKQDGSSKKLWLPEGIVIPTYANNQAVKLKIRRQKWRVTDELPKYIEVSGSMRCLSTYGDRNHGIALITESELDAMLIIQEAGDLCFCVALGGATQPIDVRTYEILAKCKIILFCPDYDDSGSRAWHKWKSIFPNIVLWPTPFEKSPGDAFLKGLDIREWIYAGIQQGGVQIKQVGTL